MHLKGLVTQFQKIVFFVMLTYCFSVVRVRSQWILLSFYWISIFFYILYFFYILANISCTMAQTPINHMIFWMSVMRTFRCIYANCFNRLWFLTGVWTKLQKNYFSGQFNPIGSPVPSESECQSLVPVPTYLTWTKTTPQKNWLFWSNLYKIEVITSLIEMLDLPNFGHMTTSTM